MIKTGGNYTVYVLICKVTGLLYVGVTCLDPEVRFNRGEGYKHNKRFYSEIKKYGWDNIERNIFAGNLSEEEAFNMEQILINKFREQNNDLVANMDSGGKHGKHCDETNEIIRKANLGRVLSEETKAKIKEARAKQVISLESIMKTAEKNRGRKMSPEFCKRLGERSSKKIRCIETNQIFDSATAASKELNVSKSGISQVCSGKIPHIKQLHFEYV